MGVGASFVVSWFFASQFEDLVPYGVGSGVGLCGAGAVADDEVVGNGTFDAMHVKNADVFGFIVLHAFDNGIK